MVSPSHEVLNCVDAPLIVFDRRRCVSYANGALGALVGRTCGQLVGRPCTELFHARARACAHCPLSEVLRTGEPRTRRETLLHADGTPVLCEFTSIPVKDSGGETVKVIDCARELGRLRGLEARLKAVEAQLQAVLGLTHESFCILDAAGAVVQASEGLARTLGLGEPGSALVTPIQKPGGGPLDPAVLNGRVALELCSPDGARIAAEASAVPLIEAGRVQGAVLRVEERAAEASPLPQAERTSYGAIIGESKRMQEVYELIDLVASSDATVLIMGENGTGKEMVAQAIHAHSHRQRGPFVVANCSAYSPTLLESELFGHERGAFTGAIRQKKGRIERSHSGTLFLDEIGDIAPATQILLLRFLQDHCFERVGGERAIQSDVRVLAATHRDLYGEVQAGRFRDDLYYRLNVIAIHLPPLRERKEDIALLAQHFLRKYAAKEKRALGRFSSNAMQALLDYDWPGNVRQLENAVSHAVILSQGSAIARRHLPRFLRDGAEELSSSSLTENERQLILRALRESNWNKHDAARRLCVSRSTLYSKIRRYGLERVC